MPQLRGALVGGAQFLLSFHSADVITSSSPLPMAVIDVSRPLVPWTWRDAFLAPMEFFALAWGVPLLVFLALLPFGLMGAGAVRLGRMFWGS
jgi:hypothetical protein